MTEHTLKAISVAEKVASLVEDGLRPIERTIAAWPAEYRAIVWSAVAQAATIRAVAAARDPVSRSGTPDAS